MFRALAPSLLGLVLTAVSCTETTSLGLTVVGDGDGVVRYTLRVYASSECPSAVHMAQGADQALGIVHEQSYGPGGGARVGELAPGTYAFAVLGRAATCEPHRFGCRSVRLGAVDRVEVPIAPVNVSLHACAEGTTCDGSGICRECTTGTCDAGTCGVPGTCDDAGSPLPREDAGPPLPPDGGNGETCEPDHCPAQVCCVVQGVVECATFAYDPRHCGECDRRCDPDLAACRQGECFERVPRRILSIELEDPPGESLVYAILWRHQETDGEPISESGRVQGELELDLDRVLAPNSDGLALGAVVVGEDLDGNGRLESWEITDRAVTATAVLAFSQTELPPGSSPSFAPRFVFPEGIGIPGIVAAYEVVPEPTESGFEEQYELRLALEEAPPHRFTTCTARTTGCPSAYP